MNSRMYNSVRNSSVALMAQIGTALISFITRTIFIKTLGALYLGVNGLFSNILSMLSFAELGVGTAIIYEMYKPLSQNDEIRTAALMNFYGKAYRIIGVTIALAGLALVPFLHSFIKYQHSFPHLTLLYIMFLSSSVSSYFFAFKRSLIIATQNGYIDTLNQVYFLIAQSLFQIVCLVLFKDYILYLAIQILSIISSNVVISIKADARFPFLKQHRGERLDNATKKKIGKNVLAMMSHKFGSIVVSGTDNLLISAFVGVYWVGLYSNYILIITTLQTLITKISDAITASIGDLTATEGNERSYSVFKKVYFFQFIITVYCSVVLYITVNPFISIWIGEKYTLGIQVVSLIIINFFIIMMRRPAIIYVDTTGLFWQLKWKSLFEAGINLVASLLLLTVFHMGISGVLLGTTISNVLTNVWWEPFVVYKYQFGIRFVGFLVTYFKYVSICLLCVLLSTWTCHFVGESGIWCLLVRVLICTVTSTILLLSIFHRSEELRYFAKLLRNVFARRLQLN